MDHTVAAQTEADLQVQLILKGVLDQEVILVRQINNKAKAGADPTVQGTAGPGVDRQLHNAACLAVQHEVDLEVQYSAKESSL